FSSPEIQHGFPQEVLFVFSGEAESADANENTQLLQSDVDSVKEILETPVRTVFVAFCDDGVRDFDFEALYVNKPDMDMIAIERSKVFAFVDARWVNSPAVHAGF